MSKRKWWVRAAALAALAAGLLGLSAGPAWSVGGPIDMPETNEPRVAGARVLSGLGLVTSQGVFQAFTRMEKNETVYTRDLAVSLPGFRNDLEVRPKSVVLSLRGNLPGLSESPVLETAVILHDSRAFDLDFSLLRGRVVITNKKEKGPAKVWVRAARQGAALTLAEPGDSAALEIFGRWPAGVPFSLNPRPGEEEPMRVWELYALKGRLEIKAGRSSWTMAEPPGPAYFHGDNVDGPAPGGPEKLAKLPDWADPRSLASIQAKLVAAVVDTYRSSLKSKDAAEAGEELLAAIEKDRNPLRSRMARAMLVHAACALDEVERVLERLEKSKFEVERRTAVVALRHWIGAAPGRDRKLYDILLGERFSRAEAETIMQLLHSPFNPQQPETYETLIAYLNHRRQAVRELASWHLRRLAPAGRAIAFDASAAEAARKKAVGAWQKLIPSGELPPPPKEEKEKGPPKPPKEKEKKPPSEG